MLQHPKHPPGSAPATGASECQLTRNFHTSRFGTVLSRGSPSTSYFPLVLWKETTLSWYLTWQVPNNSAWFLFTIDGHRVPVMSVTWFMQTYEEVINLGLPHSLICMVATYSCLDSKRRHRLDFTLMYFATTVDVVQRTNYSALLGTVWHILFPIHYYGEPPVASININLTLSQ